MENTTKMTQIDIYERIKEIVSASEEADVSVIVEFCDKKIAQAIDKKEKAQAKAAEKKAESDAMTDAIARALTAEPQTAEDILTKIIGSFEDATKAKVISRLGKLVKAGAAKREKVGKEPMTYTIA